MRIQLSSSPGQPGRPNEDFVGSVPGAVVLLDGAGIPGTDDRCRHGVAWYTHHLGGALLGRLSRDDGGDLAPLLGDAIDEVTDRHRDTCAVTDPSSPQATVLLLRWTDGRVEYLMLGDTFLLLERAAQPLKVLTDEREVAARRECSAPLTGLRSGTPEHARAHAAAVEALRARRNQPGGYWLAKDDPEAARNAVRGDVTTADLRAAALLSNGASRVVDPYAVLGWPEVLDVLRSQGAAALLGRLRDFEADSVFGNDTDDATVAYAVWG